MSLNTFTDGAILRIFVDEDDRISEQPAHVALIMFLKDHGVGGVTVFRGLEGFGTHHTLHAATPFAWRPNLPIVIEVVGEEARLLPLLDHLRAMMSKGLLTLSPVRFLQVSS